MGDNIGLNNVEQIREIIFGSQMRDFQNQIKNLDSNIQKIEDDMVLNINSFKKELKSEVKETFVLLEQKIDTLSKSVREKEEDLKDLISKSEQNLKEEMENSQDELNTKIDAFKEKQEQKLEVVKNDIQNLNYTLKKDFGIEVNVLDEKKLSKSDLSEMLVDFAMKLKDSDVLRESKIEDDLVSKLNKLEEVEETTDLYGLNELEELSQANHKDVPSNNQ